MRLTIRLLPAVAPELEWHLLLHDMLVGERAGARLLAAMSDEAADLPPLRRMLLRQTDDERRHAASYRALLGQQIHATPRYEDELEALVRGLPNLTLRVFALQALIEGISLGALRYRERAVADAPSREVDAAVRADELRHVRFAYGFMRDLVARDGRVERAAFDEVTARTFALFERSFRRDRLSAFVRRAYGVDAGDGAGDAPGRRALWSFTSRTVLKNRAAFLRRYEAVAGAGVADLVSLGGVQ